MPVTVLPNDLPPKDELCPNNDCRGPITIKLIKEDGSIFEQKYEYLYPIIQSMGITIFPGENIKITGTFENNKLTNIRALRETDQDPPLFIFSLSQDDKDTMLLKVTNNSDTDIKYHLVMMPLKEGKFLKTSSCPIPAGIAAYEFWSYPIYQLMIPEIFIVEIKDQATCEY